MCFSYLLAFILYYFNSVWSFSFGVLLARFLCQCVHVVTVSIILSIVPFSVWSRKKCHDHSFIHLFHLFICLSVFLLFVSFSSVSLSLVASTMGVSRFLAACHLGKINVCVCVCTSNPIQFIWRHQIQSSTKENLEQVNLAKLAWT